MNENERLQKLLAVAGLGSRREIERWIADGRIKVNGEIAELGQRASHLDKIQVDGKDVKLESTGKTRRILAYNKPEGEVCTQHDPEGRPTVFDKLPKLKGERWVNVGRLDINTSGLLLFTTDGELANKLMHPSSGIDREYAVRVRGEVTETMISNLKTGVMLEDGMAKFTDVQYFDGDGSNQWYHVVLMEGKKREVRRLWDSQGVTVSRLKRVRYGCIFMPKQVPVGTWVELKQKEADDLCTLAGVEPKPVKHLDGQEKEKYDRQARKQKVRQKTTFKKRH
ncbi:23S rRNA pseudouridylate synthase B [Oleispira antarctica]|uniref:Pseudouridine synthase n=1 Tax=Oleispira antarctica TaxID=188908 RepID=A0A1Y5HS15_OLEAN|nr:23S rRNA pseudouridylate synthase B [Oleispira antarctica]